MSEPYRTLLGHFRHEIAHYYWDHLVADTPAIEDFRRLFGDEREDYGAALQRHYAQGPPASWQDSRIANALSIVGGFPWANTQGRRRGESSGSSCHPWQTLPFFDGAVKATSRAIVAVCGDPAGVYGARIQ